MTMMQNASSVSQTTSTADSPIIVIEPVVGDLQVDEHALSFCSNAEVRAAYRPIINEQDNGMTEGDRDGGMSRVDQARCSTSN